MLLTYTVCRDFSIPYWFVCPSLTYTTTLPRSSTRAGKGPIKDDGLYCPVQPILRVATESPSALGSMRNRCQRAARPTRRSGK